MGLEARIWAFRIRFEPQDWDLGLGTRIWASKLGGGYGRRRNSCKSVRWSAVPVAPMLVYVSVMVRGAAAPKGSMTYVFTHMGNFLFLLLPYPPTNFEAQILVPRPKSQSHGPNPSQKAQILASRLTF